TSAPAGGAAAGKLRYATPNLWRRPPGGGAGPPGPRGGTDGGRYLTSVAWTPRGVTAVGYEEGATGLPSPLLLTGGR
ncbi:hypothetical protein ACFVEM_08065, partial [Streptomyces tendae]|uniref:hypothetical protein n=1 Tax=Streptomyces tendae TaxID=1932 RepID=UPI0036973E1A